jgi:gamma-glutamyltranspeptidase / glutathione hydrolase
VLTCYRQEDPVYAAWMKAAIAAGHPITAEAGSRVLANGGNAVDACVAAAFAAFVAEPPLTGPAGGGFLLAYVDGEPLLLDCFFAVPSRPLAAMDEIVIDFGDASTQVFHVGEASVAVPGLVPGLEEAHLRFGRLAWAELVEPAIELAHAGLDVNEAQAFLHLILAGILQRDEGGRRIYGDPLRLFTQDLVPTLERIRDRGAAAILDLVPELADDLAAYRVAAREPVRTTFLGHDVLATPAPSRGGGIVAAALERLQHASSLGERAAALRDAYATAPPARMAGTTHISVIDAAGNAAALSSTLGSGSGVFRAGAQLNNMLGERDVIGHAELEPGARLASMMTPTLVLEDGRPRLALGSAGSVRLAGAIAQVTDAAIRGVPLAEAIDAPRLHVDGDVLHLEGGCPDETPSGWEVVRWAGRNLYFGGVSAVARSTDGTFAAAGDPRRGGHGIVVE